MTLAGPLAGLGASAAWGAGDFWAGFASRRVHVLVVGVVSQTVGLLLLPIAALALREPWPAGVDWAWAIASGASAFVGVTCLWAALAAGRMGVAAPLTGVLAAALPVAYAWTVGDLPGAVALLGMALAFGGIALVSGPKAERPTPRVLLLSVASGVGFAGFFVLISLASRDAYAWTMFGSRVGTMSGMLIALAVARPSPRGIPWAATLAAAGGVLAGDMLFLASTRLTTLDVAVVLSSLYPAATVLLARFVLHERLTRLQAAGAALMVAAIPLIALG